MAASIHLFRTAFVSISSSAVAEAVALDGSGALIARRENSGAAGFQQKRLAARIPLRRVGAVRAGADGTIVIGFDFIGQPIGARPRLSLRRAPRLGAAGARGGSTLSIEERCGSNHEGNFECIPSSSSISNFLEIFVHELHGHRTFANGRKRSRGSECMSYAAEGESSAAPHGEFLYRLVPAPDAAKSVETFLLLHGTGGDENDLLPLGQMLARERRDLCS
jgi:hypothetical protein